MAKRVRGVYGTPWSKLAGGIAISDRVLKQLGECLVKVLSTEAKKDFARRGWSGKAPHAKDGKQVPGGPPVNGGPPIWDSFSYQVRGKSTLEITSTYWGLDAMTQSGGVEDRRMTWLTQQKKNMNPSKFDLTKAERKARMKKGGRLSKGQRRPLVVPIKTKAGTVVFRTAPLRFSEAWIHPGIARFTFMERAIKKGREMCAEILGEELIRQLAEGDPTR